MPLLTVILPNTGSIAPSLLLYFRLPTGLSIFTFILSLDKTLDKRGHNFARYADDFTILVKSQRSGERVLASISLFLQQQLKLVVNDKKSRVGEVKDTKFLDFGFKRNHIKIHGNSLDKFKHRVRQLTNRNWGIAMVKQIEYLSRYLRGWGNYSLIAKEYQLTVGLDHWIRRRIRMCYWRQTA